MDDERARIYKETIGKRVKYVREKEGMSIKEASKISGIPPKTWEKMEQGVFTNRLGVKDIVVLESALGEELGYFLTWPTGCEPGCELAAYKLMKKLGE